MFFEALAPMHLFGNKVVKSQRHLTPTAVASAGVLEAR
jgi:hypothetical protein